MFPLSGKAVTKNMSDFFFYFVVMKLLEKILTMSPRNDICTLTDRKVKTNTYTYHACTQLFSIILKKDSSLLKCRIAKTDFL